jgi:hypothetical protein
MPTDVTVDELLAAIRQWQSNQRGHPLTCGNDSSHHTLDAALYHGRVVLTCRDCDWEQDGRQFEWMVPPPAAPLASSPSAEPPIEDVLATIARPVEATAYIHALVQRCRELWEERAGSRAMEAAALGEAPLARAPSEDDAFADADAVLRHLDYARLADRLQSALQSERLARETAEQDRENYAALVKLVQEVNGSLRLLPLVGHETPQDVFNGMYAILDRLARWLIDTSHYPGRPAPRPVPPHTPGFRAPHPETRHE